MVWQRARELGALPTRLVQPREIFEWHTLEPWADEVSEKEAKAELSGKPEDKPEPTSLSGSRVVPGKSEVVKTDHDLPRRKKPGSAETP